MLPVHITCSRVKALSSSRPRSPSTAQASCSVASVGGFQQRAGYACASVLTRIPTQSSACSLARSGRTRHLRRHPPPCANGISAHSLVFVILSGALLHFCSNAQALLKL